MRTVKVLLRKIRDIILLLQRILFIIFFCKMRIIRIFYPHVLT